MSFPSFFGGAFLPDLVYPLQIFDKSAHDLNEVIAPIKGIVMKEILTVWQLAVADWLIIYEKFPLALALSELDSASLIIVVFRFHRGRPPVGKQWSGISWRKPTVVFSWGASTGCSSSSSSSAPFTCQSTPGAQRAASSHNDLLGVNIAAAFVPKSEQNVPSSCDRYSLPVPSRTEEPSNWARGERDDHDQAGCRRTFLDLAGTHPL